MKYYEHAGITIYHGDCREILPTLEPVDLVLTDPPYGLPGEDPEAAASALRSVTPQRGLVISDWRRPDLFGTLWPGKVGEIAWEYGWVSGGRAKARLGCLPTHNTVHVYGANVRFLGGSIIKRGPGLSSPRQCSFAAKTGHPHEKPIKLGHVLLDGIPDVSAVVDPFAGSGAFLLAASQRGVPAIGIEIEERYCEIAAKRLAQEVLPRA